MTPRERAQLIEQAASAFRPHAGDELTYHAAWRDLDAAGRVEAYELARRQRVLEAALDPGGLSTTARAVMSRIVRP
jgi:hypothetical protein